MFEVGEKLFEKTRGRERGVSREDLEVMAEAGTVIASQDEEPWLDSYDHVDFVVLPRFEHRMKPCAKCGALMPMTRKNRRYCSDRCRPKGKYWRWNRKPAA